MAAKAGKKGQGAPRASPKPTMESIEELQAYYEEKFRLFEASVEAKVETLHRIVENKEETIGKLYKEIGELKKSLDFMSNETSVIKDQIKSSNDMFKTQFQKSESTMVDLQAKTVDLEDRSRRSNLVFFGFKEAAQGVKEDCDKKVESLIQSLNLLNGEDIWIDRAHRIGIKKPEHESKPRPIIVKFSYYKQKEMIIRNGNRFKDCPINVSEDYSKDTLQTHKKLRTHGIDAKTHVFDNKMAIKFWKVTYRRLLLTYTVDKNNADARTFIKSYSLKDIQENPNWFIPKPQSNGRQNV